MKKLFFAIMIVILGCRGAGGESDAIPDSLDGKVEMLSGSVAESDISIVYFLDLSPEVVQVVTRKLNEILREESSSARKTKRFS